MAGASTHGCIAEGGWRGKSKGVIFDLLEMRISLFEQPGRKPDIFVPYYAHFEHIWARIR
jgi:hypothetical protein